MSEVRDWNGDEPHADAGAYVLHALPEDERRAFEEHLASCASCAREVAALSDSAVRLAQPVTAEPPDHLRRRVLERIAVTPQAPYAPRVPRERPEAEVPHARPAGEPVPALVPRSPVPRILQLALAACTALAVAFGGVAAWQYQAAEQARSQLHRAEDRYAGVADVLAAPDVELHTQQLADGGTGTIAVSRSQDAAVFFATGVPPLPVGQTYALWFSEDGSYRPAGLVSGAEAQDMQMLNGPVSGATAVGITIEPVGGSSQPTGPPLGLIDIPA
ncbi:anti-sigma factor domain-containing protein [Streptomyces wuyuanensis]|uniref:anti-sigma factor n=1 Tax=Streptomyces wuyuanensis TaxID=1196353 RepID=UPI003822AA26